MVDEGNGGAIGTPRESWLRHGSSHDRYARAMMLCQDMSGACTRDGACFAPTDRTADGLSRRLDKIEQAICDIAARLSAKAAPDA